MKKKKCATTTVRVRYAETDRMGVGYYANYPVWFEVARAELMRSSGVPYDTMEQDGFFLPVVHLSVDYRAPSFYDDVLEIVSFVKEINSRKIVFHYDVKRDGTLIAQGSTVHVCTDSRANTIRLPERVIDALSTPG